MRDSINGLWLIGIVMTLMVFIIAFVAISLNYSNAYRMKSEMVNAIEQYNGINGNTVQKLDSIANCYGYRTAKKCAKKDGIDVIGVKDDMLQKIQQMLKTIAFIEQLLLNYAIRYILVRLDIHTILMFFSLLIYLYLVMYLHLQ